MRQRGLTFARQGRSGSNLQSENGCCSVAPMQRECSAAFTWRLMDFSTADGWEGVGGWVGQDRACYCSFGKPCGAATQSESRIPSCREETFRDSRADWSAGRGLKRIHHSGPYHTCTCICTAAAALEFLRVPQADALCDARHALPRSCSHFQEPPSSGVLTADVG